MAGADRTILERIRGKRMRDIELPPETAPDPRLKGKSTSEGLAKAAAGFKLLQKKGILGGKGSMGGKR
jgi:hypothetical protein